MENLSLSSEEESILKDFDFSKIKKVLLQRSLRSCNLKIFIKTLFRSPEKIVFNQSLMLKLCEYLVFHPFKSYSKLEQKINDLIFQEEEKERKIKSLGLQYRQIEEFKLKYVQNVASDELHSRFDPYLEKVQNTLYKLPRKAHPLEKKDPLLVSFFKRKKILKMYLFWSKEVRSYDTDFWEMAYSMFLKNPCYFTLKDAKEQYQFLSNTVPLFEEEFSSEKQEALEQVNSTIEFLRGKREDLKKTIEPVLNCSSSFKAFVEVVIMRQALKEIQGISPNQKSKNKIASDIEKLSSLAKKSSLDIKSLTVTLDSDIKALEEFDSIRERILS